MLNKPCPLCGGILQKSVQESIQYYLFCRASQSVIDLDRLPEWLIDLEKTRKHNAEVVNFLRKIMLLGLLRASSTLRDRALELLDAEKECDDDVCPECEGAGEVAGDYFSDDGMTTCQRCGGRGTL